MSLHLFSSPILNIPGEPGINYPYYSNDREAGTGYGIVSDKAYGSGREYVYNLNLRGNAVITCSSLDLRIDSCKKREQ